MKFTDIQRKSISLIVLVTFVVLLHFWATPASAVTTTGSSETIIAQGGNDSPGFIEEESSSAPVIKKAKKFPWLLVGAVVVVGAAAIYFLVLNKKYNLTVTVGTGCTGTPTANGTYKKGTLVSYNYSPQAGYGSLQVKVDGVDVPASGTVTMDKNKALTVNAQLQRTLTVTIGAGCTGTPAATAQYNDGTAVNYSYTLMPGYKNLLVKIDGIAVPASGIVTMNKDMALKVTAVTTSLYDIRGTWLLNYHWNGANSGYAYETFSGTLTSGIISDGETPEGTYKVNGKNVEWTFYSGTKYTGTFSNKNYMSGTILSFDNSTGYWSASRTANSPTTSALTSQSVKGKKNAAGEQRD